MVLAAASLTLCISIGLFLTAEQASRHRRRRREAAERQRQLRHLEDQRRRQELASVDALDIQVKVHNDTVAIRTLGVCPNS